ncbi:hypothetical protein EIN_435670, partial [Entamoeba invadens IP1]
MQHLEMFYLAQVSLYLPTMKDVANFVQVNHKTYQSISCLKVNPWFTTKEDIEKFCNIHTTDTINCNSFNISKELLNKATFIRNYLVSYEETKDWITSEFCSKFTTFILMESVAINTEMFSQMFKIVIDSNVTKVKMTVRTFYNFLLYIKESVDIKIQRKLFKTVFLYFQPCKSYAIYMGDQDETSEMFEKINEAVKTLSCDIYIDWSDEKGFDQYVSLTPNCKNYASTIFLDVLDTFHPICNSGLLTINTTGFRKMKETTKLESVIRNCYPTKIEFVGNGIDMSQMKLDDTIEVLKIKYIEPQNETEMGNNTNEFTLPKILNVNKVVCVDTQITFFDIYPSVKKVSLENFTCEVKTTGKSVKKVWESIHDFPFVCVEEMLIKNSRKEFDFMMLKQLKKLNIVYTNNCDIFVNKSCAKDINLTQLNNCTVTIDAEEHNDFSFNMFTNTNFVFLNDKDLKLHFSNCQNMSVTTQNVINSLTLDSCAKTAVCSKVINLNVSKSELTSSHQICAENITLCTIKDFIPISFIETKKVYLFNMNNFVFKNTFENCTTLKVDYCDNCEFWFEANKLEILSLNSSKNIQFVGNFDSIQGCVVSNNSTFKFPSKLNSICHKVQSSNEDNVCVTEMMTYEEYNTAKDKLVSSYSKMANNNMRDLDTKTETVETKDVVIDHLNFVLRNCVCSPTKSICLIQKIDILNFFTIENYCGSLPNLCGVVCGTFELVNYINPTPGGLIQFGAPNIIFKKCVDLGFILDGA